MKLYGFWRSSAAYRVRIALAIKGLTYDAVSIHLSQGEHNKPEYGEINPQHLVPVLEDEGERLYQSLAIIQYLEDAYPEPPLIPDDPSEACRVRSLALIIACEIHPLNNPRVLNYLTNTFAITDEQRREWYHHWIKIGFTAFEKRLADERWTGRFCHGDAPTLADVCLVPQVANARRFAVDMTAYPCIVRIDAACRAMAEFQAAAPERQV